MQSRQWLLSHPTAQAPPSSRLQTTAYSFFPFFLFDAAAPSFRVRVILFNMELPLLCLLPLFHWMKVK